MSDLISRQAVLREFLCLSDDAFVINRKIQEIVKKLPSVEPERKVGHWIEHEWAEESDGYLISNFECDKCHAWAEADYAYCPFCGAKMEVVGWEE